MLEKSEFVKSHDILTYTNFVCFCKTFFDVVIVVGLEWFLCVV